MGDTNYCFFLPTTVTAEMRGGIFTEGPQISASRAGCQGGRSRQPLFSSSPLPLLQQRQILFTCKAHGKANLFSQAFPSGIWGKVQFINRVCACVSISICAGGKGSAMIDMYCIFGLYSVTAAGQHLMRVFNTPNTENSKQKSKVCSGQETGVIFLSLTELMKQCFTCIVSFRLCSVYLTASA